MSSSDSVRQATTNRIMRAHPDLFIRFGIDAVREAIDDQASMYAETQLDEIGSSDVSCWVKSIEQDLERRFPNK